MNNNKKSIKNLTNIKKLKQQVSLIGLKVFALMLVVALGISGVIFVVAYRGMSKMLQNASLGMTEMEVNAGEIAGETLLDMTESTVQVIASASAENINLIFERVSGEVFMMSQTMNKLYCNWDDELKTAHAPKSFEETHDQVMMGRGAIANSVEITNDILEEQALTAKIEYASSGVFNSNTILHNVLVGTETGIFYRYSKYNQYDSDYDVRSRDWYVKAVENPGRIVWSNAYTEFYGNKVVTCSMSYKDQYGQVAGVIGCDVLIQSIVDEIEDDDTETGYAFILGADGRYVAHPNSGEEAFVEDPRAEGNKQLDIIVDAMLAGETGIGTVDNAHDHSYDYYAYAPIESTDWSFAIVIKSEAVRTPAQSAMKEITNVSVKTRNAMLLLAKNTSVHFIIIFIICIVVISFIAALVSALFQRPIHQLVNGAKTIGTGNLDYRIPEKGKDELAMLASEFNSMAINLEEYIERLTIVTEEKQRIGAELNVATRIQTDMLPNIFPPFPDQENFDLYASMDPAKEVGGDFYDFFMLDDHRLALVIADVSGKGVPAALFMVISKTLIKNQSYTGDSVEQILSTVNKRLCESNSADMFVTVWIGIIDINTGHMECANAGHEFPFVRRKDGKFEVFKDRHGFVLGGMNGVSYKKYEIQLNGGDAIFVYTDGIPEANDAEQNMFGMERAQAALNIDPMADPKTLLKNVRSEVDRFVGDAPQFDDMTMLCYVQKHTISTSVHD